MEHPFPIELLSPVKKPQSSRGELGTNSPRRAPSLSIHIPHTLPQSADGAYIFPDLKAISGLLKYVQEYEEVEVSGFEIYIVEQWAYERKIGCVITSYTGSRYNTIKAVRLKPTPEFGPYFRQMDEYTQVKETEEGLILITNLASFPSGLNLLHVSCGDIRAVWDAFQLNINLKKLRCGGRSALLLCEPSYASEDKFRQIFKTNDKILVAASVNEMITLVQISLSYFNMFPMDSIDGLLCNTTEKGISQWWEQFGKYYVGIRPKNEAILGPSTVAALLSMVLTCFNKMNDYAQTKDPFNVNGFMATLFQFQKKHGMTRSLITRQFLEKLFTTTQNNYSDLLNFKKIKSKVQDISTKVNARQGTVEVLTTSLEVLVLSIHGGSMGLLWKGKGRPRSHLYIADFRKMSFNSTRVPQVTKTKKRTRVKNMLVGKKDHESLTETETETETDTDSDVEVLERVDENPKVKKNVLEDVLFNNELYRRSTHPVEPNISQLDYENLPYIDCSVSCRRARSMSAIECHSSSVTATGVAREVFQLHKRHHEYLQMCAKFEKTTLDYKHTVTSKRLANAVSNSKFKPVEKSYLEAVSKDTHLNRELVDLDAMTARLKYDMRILDTRVRDVEETILTMDGKLAQLQKKLLAQPTEVILPWYSRWF